MKSRLCLSFAFAAGLSLASTSAHADDSEAYGPRLQPPVETPSLVLVHLSSKGPARLETRDVGETWVAVCDAPCDREVPVGDAYRIAYGTKGQTAGRPFRLKPTSRAIELKVAAPSTAASVGGGVLLGLGVVLTAVGGLGLVTGVAAAAGPADSCAGSANDWCVDGQELGKALVLVSLVPLLLGGAMIAGGAAVMSDAKGNVEQRPAAGREPTWAQPRAEMAPRKAGFVTPLSFSF